MARCASLRHGIFKFLFGNVRCLQSVTDCRQWIHDCSQPLVDVSVNPELTFGGGAVGLAAKLVDFSRRKALFLNIL
ncbi:hypothetical protein HMPREF2547_06315 [Corynebacterium sp. HMSC055G02]|nr:hypothetical protein HMPREF2547_06315 [Corynebacterium sp. HMSC055G02]OFQ03234.1 hypothetical protein HMPREF2960_03555 [Corynebacterium sp. HMSC070B05]OHQ65308.1 hypothetical protein HMPREF2657_09755 [Corynebacterium sp. HMSC072B08]OHR34274.1 hypothetical protein HMPREF3042_02255 [Corynebacterium sp. HMSC074C05]TXS79461.1 hypothetical protein CHU72_08845 [Corynebacterium sp. LK12]